MAEKIDTYPIRMELVGAIDKWIEKGGILLAGMYGTDGSACPLRCLLLAKKGTDDRRMTVASQVRIYLGWKEEQTAAFNSGWDWDNGDPFNTYQPEKYPEYFELGRDLRKQYKYVFDKQAAKDEAT